MNSEDFNLHISMNIIASQRFEQNYRLNLVSLQCFHCCCTVSVPNLIQDISNQCIFLRSSPIPESLHSKYILFFCCFCQIHCCSVQTQSKDCVTVQIL